MSAMVVALLLVAPAGAAAPGELAVANDGALATAAAVPIAPDNDLVTVVQRAQLSPSVRDRALRAAQRAGVPAVLAREFGIGLRRVSRGTVTVQQSAGSGWAFPMAATALPPDGLTAIMGRTIAAMSVGRSIVISATTAGLRGAQAGDTMDLVGFDGVVRTFSIAMVAPDESIGGTEILMSATAADLLGATLPTQVVLYGHLDKATVDAALAAEGLDRDPLVRIRTTWDAPNPDALLGIGAIKAALGEFQYYWAGLVGTGNAAVDSTWLSVHVAPSRRTFPSGVTARCNLAIAADLTAALQAVVDAGLASLIDLTNTNAYGGCTTGSARYNRIAINLHLLSKHSWGGAIDMNTVTNCQGCVPAMDCRIVRIFRAHGFAWGGNSITADGMHFEWVGQPRDQLSYPSRYCPNVVAAPNASANTSPDAAPPPAMRETLFAGDGSLGE